MNPATRLLYLSPVLPALGGNGLAMRAGMILEVLAARYRPSLLVVPLYPSPAPELPAALAALCEDTAILAPDEARRVRPFGRGRFQVVHVFRLAMVEYARPYLGGKPWRRPRRHLDLDDIESSSAERLAALYRGANNLDLARQQHLAAARARLAETQALARFDRLYVCSEADRERLSGRGRAGVCVLPNAVRLPEPPPPPRHDPFTFLFAGTLDYYPNEDAALFFCRAVLPHLRLLAPMPFRVVVIGVGARRPVLELGREPGVEVLGAVPSIAPHYHRASAVVVPLRAGGGTRIKVLEAFSYERPVIATPIGIEGIEARDGQEALIAEGPAAFAAACARLMREPALAAALAARARALLLRAYTPEALIQALDRCASG